MSNTLFPPIVEPYQPVFLNTNATVYFKIPSFFNPASYSIRLKAQTVDSNEEIFIKTKTFSNLSYLAEKDLYAFSFSWSPQAALNTYYKINLQIYKTGVAESEWSTSTYIRRISTPNIGVSSFNLEKIFCDYSFTDLTETETFKSCYLQVVGKETGETILLNKKIGEFEYTFKSVLANGDRINLYYETENGYQGQSISFQTVNWNVTKSNENILSFSEPSSGCNSLFLKTNSSNAYIRRASYLSDYTEWETIGRCNEAIVLSPAYNGYNYYWQDLTAESGNVYKYQVLDTDNDIYYTTTNTTTLDLEMNYLIDKDNFLEISCNPTIDSVKYVTTESITNTLGSKYPIIRRNGDVKYKQFNIGGLISFLAEREYNITEDSIAGKTFSSNSEYTIFTKENCLSYPNKKPKTFTKSTTFTKAENDYKNHKKARGIQDCGDVVLEKIYRDAVMEFLTDGNPKLFKSGPEGNMIVQLTGITFKPEKALGRMIYSFTATATEIAEPTYANYVKYNLVKGGL